MQNRRLSRRQFLAGTGLMGAGLVVAACAPKAAPAPTAAPAAPTAAPAATAVPAATAAPAVVKGAKAGLAPGMIGGPTGFPGCRALSVSGPDSPAGRAMLALQALPKDKKPEKLVMMLPTGATGTGPCRSPPTGADRPAGLRGRDRDQDGSRRRGREQPDTKIMQDTTTKAGRLRPLLVLAARQGHPVRGRRASRLWMISSGSTSRSGTSTTPAASKRSPVQLLRRQVPYWSTSTGTTRAGATAPTCSKTRRIEGLQGEVRLGVCSGPRPGNSSTRSPSSSTGRTRISLGCTDLRNPVWRQVNFYQRFCCMADPEPDAVRSRTPAKPFIDPPAGIETVQWMTDSLKWHSKDALSWGWPEQYANWAAGGAAMTARYPNVTKFLDNPNNQDSKIVGKMKTGLVPGKIINGKLIRRGTWWPNIAQAVSTQTKYPEAAYLTLQWAQLGADVRLDGRQSRRLLRPVPDAPTGPTRSWSPATTRTRWRTCRTRSSTRCRAST